MRKSIWFVVTLLVICSIYLYVNGLIKKVVYPVPDETSVSMIDGGVIVDAQQSGQESKGLFVKKGEVLVVLFHGNGSTVNDLLDVAQIFIKANCSVLVVEYPGYGILNNYKPNEKAIYNSSETLINKIADEYGYKNIIPFGHSLGAAIAIEMSKRGIGSRLIIVSGFTSLDDMISLNSPRVIATIFNREKYNNLEKLKTINVNTLIIHGRDDKIVPFYMAELLAKDSVSSKLLPVKNGTHLIFAQMNNDQWDTVLKFALGEES